MRFEVSFGSSYTMATKLVMPSMGRSVGIGAATEFLPKEAAGPASGALSAEALSEELVSALVSAPRWQPKARPAQSAVTAPPSAR